MTRNKVFASGSNPSESELQSCVIKPTDDSLTETPGKRQLISSLENGRVRAKETKDHESSSRVACPEMAQSMKRQSILEWYVVLRTRHQWTVFQAIRYALWLAR